MTKAEELRKMVEDYRANENENKMRIAEKEYDRLVALATHYAKQGGSSFCARLGADVICDDQVQNYLGDILTENGFVYDFRRHNFIWISIEKK